MSHTDDGENDVVDDLEAAWDLLCTDGLTSVGMLI